MSLSTKRPPGFKTFWRRSSKEGPLIDIPEPILSRVEIELATIGGDEIETAKIGRQLLVRFDRVLDDPPKVEPLVEAFPERKEARLVEADTAVAKLPADKLEIAGAASELQI